MDFQLAGGASGVNPAGQTKKVSAIVALLLVIGGCAWYRVGTAGKFDLEEVRQDSENGRAEFSEEPYNECSEVVKCWLREWEHDFRRMGGQAMGTTEMITNNFTIWTQCKREVLSIARRERKKQVQHSKLDNCAGVCGQNGIPQTGHVHRLCQLPSPPVKQKNTRNHVNKKNMRNSFGASFPPRLNSPARWFDQGKSYYPYLYEKLRSAQREIFLTGWQLSYDVELHRPLRGNSSSLGSLLKEKASQGVKIHLAIWHVFAANMAGIHTGSKLVQEQFSSIPGVEIVLATPGMRWSHHEKLVIIDRAIAFVGGMDLTMGRWDDANYRLFDDEVDFFEGQDYRNPFQNPNGPKPSDGWNSRFAPDDMPRCPWQDIGSVVYGNAAADIARFFIDRWNSNPVAWDDRTFLDKWLHNKPPPKNYKKIPVTKRYRSQDDVIRIEEDFDNNRRSEEQFSQMSRLTYADIYPLRSKTSAKKIEDSIYQSMLDLISDAERYVYIETQYFMSNASDDGSMSADAIVRNDVMGAIVRRISKAHDRGEPFKVFLVLPLMPETDYQNGGVFNQEGNCDLTYHLQQASIYKGPHSLLKKLDELNIPAEDYIHVGGLRQWGAKDNQSRPQTELIYVHSKLMIIDDKHALIGSANINDRSLQGDRDTEVSVLYKNSAAFASSLRKQLWHKYLGLQRDDPKLSRNDEDGIQQLAEYWKRVAANNTKIYEEVFTLVPVNHVRTFVDLENHKRSGPSLSESNYLDAHRRLGDLEGVLVDYPVHFLEKEDYLASCSNIEQDIAFYQFVYS